MITENRTIKTQFCDFESAQKALTHRLFVLSVIMLVIGSAGIIAYIALGTIFETPEGKTPLWVDAFLFFAVPFAFGLIFTISLTRQVKNAKKFAGSVNDYEFYSDCLIMSEIRHGVSVGVARLEYNQIVKVRQKGKYLFFGYRNGMAVYPMDITALSAEELNTVKKLLCPAFEHGGTLIELSQSRKDGVTLAVNAENPENVENTENKG